MRDFVYKDQQPKLHLSSNAHSHRENNKKTTLYTMLCPDNKKESSAMKIQPPNLSQVLTFYNYQRLHREYYSTKIFIHKNLNQPPLIP